MKRTFGSAMGLILIGLFLAATPASAADATDGQRSLKREKDCSDFPSQAAAQHYFDQNGGSPSNNVDDLDADGDGVVCESNPCPCAEPGGDDGGGGSGGGGGNKDEPVITQKLCGKFKGVPDSRVCLRAKLKGEELTKVKSFRFKTLPTHCSDGSNRTIAGKDARIMGKGKRFRSRSGKVVGPASGERIVIAGKVSGGGKKARGTVRVRYRAQDGAQCDSRNARWKAT